MNIKPVSDNIVVKRDKAKIASDGGIVLPDIAQETQNTCTVLAVGPGAVTDAGNRLEMPVKVGDRIILQPLRSGYPSIDGGKLVLINAGDVFGVITENVEIPC